jgi:hypothetical protein
MKTVGLKRHENVAPAGSDDVTPTTKWATMKRKRSANWDLMYGFVFLVIFIVIHTLFITHETG